MTTDDPSTHKFDETGDWTPERVAYWAERARAKERATNPYTGKPLTRGDERFFTLVAGRRLRGTYATDDTGARKAPIGHGRLAGALPPGYAGRALKRRTHGTKTRGKRAVIAHLTRRRARQLDRAVQLAAMTAQIEAAEAAAAGAP